MPLRVMELNLNYHNGDLRGSGLSYRNKNPVAPEPRAQHSGAAVAHAWSGETYKSCYRGSFKGSFKGHLRGPLRLL